MSYDYYTNTVAWRKYLEEVTSEEEATIRAAAREAAALSVSPVEFTRLRVCPSLEARFRPMVWTAIERYFFALEDAKLSVTTDEPLTVNELLSATGIPYRKLALMLDIPQRTVYSWTSGARHLDGWQLQLLNFRLEHDPRYGRHIADYRRKKQEADPKPEPKRYSVTCRETGDVIESGLILEEAEAMVAAWEKADREEDIFTEDFYEIVAEEA